MEGKAIFLFCKRIKADFYFLQETHALKLDYKFWKSQWGDNIWMSYGSNSSAGVATLRGQFSGNVLKSKIHDYGRWLILVIEKRDIIFIMGNIYATNNSLQNRALFQEFEEEISGLINTFPNAKLILGGDWNSIKDPLLDCAPPRSKRPNYTAEVDNLCLNLNCFDIWRHRNPDKKQFTWCTKDRSKQSRIDFWLVSRDVENQVLDVKIEPSVLTDHNLMYLSINLSDTGQSKTKFYYWKLNNMLLKDEQFLNNVRLIIKDCWNKAKSLNSYGGQWEYMKYGIRKMAIQRGKEIAKNERIKEDKTIKEIIAIYGKEILSNQDNDKLNMLHLQLDLIYEEKARGAFVRLRRKWLEEGEKNTKYFFYLEKRNAEMSSLVRLNINGQITEDPNEIKHFVSKFYELLYKKSNDVDDTNFFLFIKQNAKVIGDVSKKDM